MGTFWWPSATAGMRLSREQLDVLHAGLFLGAGFKVENPEA